MCKQYSGGVVSQADEEEKKMSILVRASDYFIPIIIFYFVGYGLLSKRDIYSDFTEGAKDGFSVVLGILPTLIGLMTAVGMLRASGFLEFLAEMLAPAAKIVFFPAELVPLVVVKMFSSSAATGLLLDLFREYGPDSYLGMLSSLICSSTETIFYTMSVYFMTVKIKKTRYTLAGALLATFTGVAVCTILTSFF